MRLKRKSPNTLKIFLMTRNEGLFIESWIKYHGDLFGFENLYIIDGSDKESIFEIYRKYEKHGLNVFHTDANLNKLEGVINEQMHQNKGENNFLIKMDTDEFLVHANLSGLNNLRYKLARKFERKASSLSKILLPKLDLRNDHFKKMFKSLPITGQRYEAPDILFSMPKLEDVDDPLLEITTFFKKLDEPNGKSFYHSDSFISTDLGGHKGTTTKNKRFIRSPLAVVHYQGISVENTIRSAKQVLISHGYINEEDDCETAKKKLLELNKKGDYLSFHKVTFYLAYLRSIEFGNTLPPESIYGEFEHRNALAINYDISLVKDSLGKLNKRGFPICIGSEPEVNRPYLNPKST